MQKLSGSMTQTFSPLGSIFVLRRFLFTCTVIEFERHEDLYLFEWLWTIAKRVPITKGASHKGLGEGR